MSSSAIKYYILPAIILVGVVVTVLVLSTKKINTPPSVIRPTSVNTTSTSSTPSSPLILPTAIPPANFTGAETTQTLPPEIQSVGEQKTALRRLTPLVLPFGTIEFDYENDIFLLQLIGSKEEYLSQFNAWRTRVYPALTEDKFVIN